MLNTIFFYHLNFQDFVAFFGYYLPENNTPPGNNALFQREDCPNGTVGGTPVTVIFDQVDVGGNTTLCTSPQGPPPSSGFKLGNPPVYYEMIFLR
jgi:hypothetical protein